MTLVPCSHPRCDQPVDPSYARFVGGRPFHVACSFADPGHDVSKGCGSPFTEITGGLI